MNYYHYFTEIEETFVRRRAKNLLLSPLDWALIEAWQERGVPLHVVLRGIEKVFDGVDSQPGRLRSVKGLSYCREEIEAQYAEWLASQTGKADAAGAAEGQPNGAHPGRSDLIIHIENAAAALKNSGHKNLRADFDRAAAGLERLRRELTDDWEKTETALTAIENFLDRALLTNTDEAHLTELEKEITGQMAAYRGKMEPEAYRKTFDLMLLKRLREEAEIPRLSLFYL